MEIEITPWEEVNQGVGATRNIRFVANLEVSQSINQDRHKTDHPLILSPSHTHTRTHTIYIYRVFLWVRPPRP